MTVHMGVFAGLYFLQPDLLLSPYALHDGTGDLAGARPFMITLLQFVAAYTFFDGAAVLISSALRGAGDTRFPLVLNVTLAWLIAAPTAYLATQAVRQGQWELGTGLYIAWAGMTTYLVCLSIGMLLRFHAGAWKSIRLIEAAPTH
jgi:multidrug resistance protein, MATE family